MFYFKATDFHRYAPSCDWGDCICYFEIGDDLYATRRVEAFANGNALRYDRIHWLDDCCSLGELKFDAKRWQNFWGPYNEITAAEFEKIWSLAETAPNQPQSYRDDAGPYPRVPAGGTS